MEYLWLVMAGLKEKSCTLILKFVYITFCLLTKPQTMLNRLCCQTELSISRTEWNGTYHFQK